MSGILSLILFGCDDSEYISHQKLIGHFVSNDGRIGRIGGRRIKPPQVHECCLDSEFWELKVQLGDCIQIWGPLLRTGGDTLSLSLNVQDTLHEEEKEKELKEFEFRTSKVKTDQSASDYISKFYPDLSFESEMVVCIGTVSWQYSSSL